MSRMLLQEQSIMGEVTVSWGLGKSRSSGPEGPALHFLSAFVFNHPCKNKYNRKVSSGAELSPASEAESKLALSKLQRNGVHFTELVGE